MRPAGLPRLLAGLGDRSGAITWAGHQRIHGPLPAISAEELIESVALSGLRGRGGADFPTSLKLHAVAAAGRAAALVVNGSETEPASAKDALLLARLPHLVLDGALVAASSVGAPQVIVKVGNGSPAIAAMGAAIAERPEGRIALVAGPTGYVTGEESAVVNFLSGGPPLPTFVPPRPYQRGLRGRPTLIQNPETLAHIALIARHGPNWYRELGTWADPGSALVTISGAVRNPGVYELAFGTRMADLLAAAGGETEPLQALLMGGYFGTWMGAEAAAGLRLAREELGGAGGSLGAGVVIALGRSACGLHESARIVAYLARQSSGQCGPCLHGLAAIAAALRTLADGRGDAETAWTLRRWCSEVRGRGACHHPDGVVRLVESTLRVFGTHGHAECRARTAGLPLGPEKTDGAEPQAGAGDRTRGV